MTRVTILSLLAITAAGCGDDPANPPPPDAPGGVAGACPDDMTKQCVDVAELITANATWTPDKVYVIPNFQHTFVQKPAVLTIMPGTEIRGGKGAVLTIARGAKIMADGTPQQPIVFTSNQTAGTKTPGYWGGVLVMGYASHNTNVLATPTPSGEVLFEAFSNADGDSGRFGAVLGQDIPTDNSGVIRYVRIEFGGFNFVADREFNNLTLCGVGSGTTVDFVQVHGGQDDGIELFGGTVNVKHIVSSQNEDDGFDADNGWRGMAQFVIVQNVAHRTGAVLEATNGYEIDNHGTATSFNATPRTQPTIANVTLVGDRAYTEQPHWGAVFRRGMAGHFVNHLWYNFTRGFEFRDTATKDQLDAGNLTVGYSIFYSNDSSASNLPAPQASGDIVEADYIRTAEAVAAGRPDPHNLFDVNPTLPAAATSRTAPDFKPAAGSPALTAANAAPANDPRIANQFFEKVAFVGAIGTDDWTAGWTKYPQN
jgi:hypothetical protein